MNYASIKSKQQTANRNKKAKDQAYIQQFNEWMEAGEENLPRVIALALAMDYSRLGRQLDYHMSRATSNQLFAYLKREPETLPVMSIGEINEASALLKFDLLERTLTFLGKTLRQLKPQRHMIHAGSGVAALYILTMEAVAAIQDHPAQGYKGIDGAIAKALNKMIGSDLPIGEDEVRYYEWDSMNEPGMGVEDTSDLDQDTPDWS